MREALEAAGLRVKPLEWIASGRDAFDALGPERVHYRVWPTVTMGHTSFGLSGDTCGYFPSLEAAQAAAQADYQARILSALAALPALAEVQARDEGGEGMSMWTGMGPNKPAPKLDPNCQCICHTQPGVMHVAACCQEPAMTDDTARLYVSIDRSGLTSRYIASPHMHPGAREWIPRDAVRVKPLEWLDVDEICTRQKAPALGGHYSLVEFDANTDEAHFAVNIDLGGLAFVFILEPSPFGGRRPKQYPTLDAAKAAAQADYEARILTALERPA